MSRTEGAGEDRGGKGKGRRTGEGGVGEGTHDYRATVRRGTDKDPLRPNVGPLYNLAKPLPLLLFNMYAFRPYYCHDYPARRRQGGCLCVG